eukprot:scaffold66313_cov50-Attheya_sp.AAC.8
MNDHSAPQIEGRLPNAGTCLDVANGRIGRLVIAWVMFVSFVVCLISSEPVAGHEEKIELFGGAVCLGKYLGPIGGQHTIQDGQEREVSNHVIDACRFFSRRGVRPVKTPAVVGTKVVRQIDGGTVVQTHENSRAGVIDGFVVGIEFHKEGGSLGKRAGTLGIIGVGWDGEGLDDQLLGREFCLLDGELAVGHARVAEKVAPHGGGKCCWCSQLRHSSP